jgi:hypothetical protein
MDIVRRSVTAITLRGHRLAVRGTLIKRTTATGRTSWGIDGISDGLPPPSLRELHSEPEDIEIEGDGRRFRGRGSFGFAATVRAESLSVPVTVHGTDDLEEFE